jgi:tetratricopeptide (TPR) repeat protein
MQQNQTREEGKTSVVRTLWMVIFCVSLFFLALCWSIDRSITYFISAVVTFCLFKVLQLRSKEEARNGDYEEDHDPYGQYRPSSFSVFIENLKHNFKSDSRRTNTYQQSHALVILIAVFFGFVFFLPIIGALFGGNDSLHDYYYTQRAEDYYNSRQYDSATYYYRLAIESDPNNADLYVQRGNAFLNAQESDSAMLMYDRAIEIDPQNQQAQFSKGNFYFDQKNYRGAIDVARKILAIEPTQMNALLLMGDSFYNQTQLDSALYWYEGAYETGYRSAVLCHLMAYIYDTKGQQETAIGLYKEAISQDSSIVAIYARLGELVEGEEGNFYRQKAVKMQSE